MARRSNYLAALALTFAALLFATGALNALVDPYGVIGAPRIEGLNAPKARLHHDIAQRKLYAAMRAKPDAVILGNSRAEVGFDPQHPAWQSRAARVFNLAVPGAPAETSAAQLAAICSTQRLAVVLVGVDFPDFLVDRRATLPPAGSFRPNGLRVSPSPSDRLLALFTLDATIASLRTLVASRQKYPEVTTADGFNPMLEYTPIAAASGYYQLFQQRLEENAKSYSRPNRVVAPPGAREATTVQALRSIIRTASTCADELILTTYPYHSQLLVLIQESGLWEDFERFKATLAEVVLEESRRAPAPFRLAAQDFAYFSLPSVERIPAPGDRATTLRWYWEAGHFKKALGNEVLEALLGDGGSPTLAPQEIKRADIPEWLAIVRQQRDDFYRMRTADVQHVVQVLSGKVSKPAGQRTALRIRDHGPR